MPKQRRNFSGAEKMAILREHLIEKTPVSEVCEKHGIQPTLFYTWQKKLFEEGSAVFEQPRAKSPRQAVAEQRKIDALEASNPPGIAGRLCDEWSRGGRNAAPHPHHSEHSPMP